MRRMLPLNAGGRFQSDKRPPSFLLSMLWLLRLQSEGKRHSLLCTVCSTSSIWSRANDVTPSLECGHCSAWWESGIIRRQKKKIAFIWLVASRMMLHSIAAQHQCRCNRSVSPQSSNCISVGNSEKGHYQRCREGYHYLRYVKEMKEWGWWWLCCVGCWCCCCRCITHSSS